MTTQAQAAAGSSPTPSGNPTPATTDWEAKSKELERQLQGLSGERNRYKQQADAWGRLAQDPRVQGAIKYDPDGLPWDWDLEVGTSRPNGQPGYAQVVNPFGDVGIDQAQANAWLQQTLQAQLAQGGYLTHAQAEALATQKSQQAYQAANQRFTTMRSVDKLLSDPLYKDLSNPQSDWGKRTAAYLQQFQAGQPQREGAGWDEWNYTAPQVLQQAADITYAQMVREQGAASVSQQQAIQNQQAAGISAGPTNVPVQISQEAAFEKTLKEGGLNAGWEAMRAQTDAKWTREGRMSP